MKINTLTVLRKNGHVVLGKKIPGSFGEGLWNFPGGKVKHGEDIDQAANRETEEETGVNMSVFEKRGIATFDFEDGTESREVHIFECTDWKGKLLPKSKEFDPIQFWDEKHLPSEMWPGDIFWLPTFFSGEKFRGHFVYNHPPYKPGAKVLKHEIIIVETFD